jgi:hypothetical protein
MHSFLQKHPLLISVLLLLSILAASLYLPAIVPALGMVSLLVMLSLSVASIVGKHAQAEHRRFKIAKDALVFIATFSLVVFFGGVTALLASSYASLRFGVVAGFASAMGASLVVGYCVRWGVGKLSGK